MKLLKQKILFALGSDKDFYSQKVYSYHSYAFIYPRCAPFKHSSVRDACLQMQKTGEIDRIIRGKEVFFRLTSQGKSYLKSFFPQFQRMSMTIDANWRIAIITSYRQNSGKSHHLKLIKLRQFLCEAGFKPIGAGVYLSPFSVNSEIKQYVSANKLANTVIFFEAKKLVVGDSAVLSHHLWGLEELNEKYTKFISASASLLEELKAKKAVSNKQKALFYKYYQLFFDLIRQDPAIPSKMLAYKWPFTRAKDVFLTLCAEFEKLSNPL